MQLGPVAAEHEIARVDAVRAGGCTVDNLTINPRASPLRWSAEVLHKHEIPVGVASDDGLFGRWSEGSLISEE